MKAKKAKQNKYVCSMCGQTADKSEKHCGSAMSKC